MADNIDKYTTHDFARIFADDIKEYHEKGVSIEGLSATNVYNILDGEYAEDIFSFTTNIVNAVRDFVTDRQGHISSNAISGYRKHHSHSVGILSLR